MKLFLIFPLVLLTSTLTYADEKKYFFEANLGRYEFNTVHEKPVSGSVLGITFTNWSADNEYDADNAVRLELGLNLSKNIRMSLSYADLDMVFEAANFSGTVSGGGTTLSLSGRATPADYRAIGLTLDNDAQSYALNLYYDFYLQNMNNLRPYLGVSLGEVDISNAKSDESARSLIAGMNYDINSNWYLGLKYIHLKIDGPTDTLDVEYEDLDVTSSHITLGYRF
tara:strand:+ start:559 stop:1233 length:675 start_codon:yes stop_codon:yes gene_type:complete